MNMHLSTEVITAFYLAETAIGKVLDGDTFTWKELNIKVDDLPPQHTVIVEEKLFAFSGHIVVSETLFSITSSIRSVTDNDGNCELLSVDVLCDFLDVLQMSVSGKQRTKSAVKTINYFTVFKVGKSGDLTEVVSKP